MDIVQPTIEWYTSISRERGVPPRCPFASVYRCPRYYQSLSLLGRSGNTPIPADKDDELLSKWKGSDLWPVVDEQTTSVLSSGRGSNMYWNFCPEVIYDTFALFAESLSRVGDELDHDRRQKMLHEEGASRNDYRWNWTSAEPLHYTECPLYSALGAGVRSVGTPAATENEDRSFLLRIQRSTPARWLAFGGAVLTGLVRYSDSIKRLLESWFRR